MLLKLLNNRWNLIIEEPIQTFSRIILSNLRFSLERTETTGIFIYSICFKICVIQIQIPKQPTSFPIPVWFNSIPIYFNCMRLPVVWVSLYFYYTIQISNMLVIMKKTQALANSTFQCEYGQMFRTSSKILERLYRTTMKRDVKRSMHALTCCYVAANIWNFKMVKTN